MQHNSNIKNNKRHNNFKTFEQKEAFKLYYNSVHNYETPLEHGYKFMYLVTKVSNIIKNYYELYPNTKMFQSKQYVFAQVNTEFKKLSQFEKDTFFKGTEKYGYDKLTSSEQEIIKQIKSTIHTSYRHFKRAIRGLKEHGIIKFAWDPLIKHYVWIHVTMLNGMKLHVFHCGKSFQKMLYPLPSKTQDDYQIVASNKIHKPPPNLDDESIALEDSEIDWAE